MPHGVYHPSFSLQQQPQQPQQQQQQQQHHQQQQQWRQQAAMQGLDGDSFLLAPPSSMVDVMAAPSLHSEPPPPHHPALTLFNLQLPGDRKAPTQASSYWSVSEANDFPLLLRAYGSDWTAIAAHMGSKTAVM
ncbi:hypothetical protein E4U30_008247, partial [Claviceps sp. LM220 group G6]